MFVFMTYYFSTHGCKVWLFFGGVTTFEEPAPLAVAAAARALRSKKLDILQSPRDKICPESKTIVNRLSFQDLEVQQIARKHDWMEKGTFA